MGTAPRSAAPPASRSHGCGCSDRVIAPPSNRPLHNFVNEHRLLIKPPVFTSPPPSSPRRRGQTVYLFVHNATSSCVRMSRGIARNLSVPEWRARTARPPQAVPIMRSSVSTIHCYVLTPRAHLIACNYDSTVCSVNHAVEQQDPLAGAAQLKLLKLTIKLTMPLGSFFGAPLPPAPLGWHALSASPGSAISEGRRRASTWRRGSPPKGKGAESSAHTRSHETSITANWLIYKGSCKGSRNKKISCEF